MNERSHLELRQIAEQSKAAIERIRDSLTELRADYDGPAIADALAEIETSYNEIAELDNAARRAEREQYLARTRERFGLERLRENKQLSTQGFVSLGQVIYECDRAIEAFDRWINNLREGHAFDEDVSAAIEHTGEAVHWAYLVCRPPDSDG